MSDIINYIKPEDFADPELLARKINQNFEEILTQLTVDNFTGERLYLGGKRIIIDGENGNMIFYDENHVPSIIIGETDNV